MVYTLNNYGQRTAEHFYNSGAALTRTMSRVYDTLGRLQQTTGAAGTAAVTTTYAYDADGNQTNVNMPMSRNIVNGYDVLDRLASIQDPGLSTTTFTYDAADNIKAVADPRGLATSYTYNGLGDLTQQDSPDTGTSFFVADAAGNRTSATDARGKTGTSAYDALNRVTSVTYPGESTSYTYDQGTNGKGRLTTLTRGSVTVGYTYDTRGRVTGKSQVIGSVVRAVGYGYVNGRLASMVLPSGRTVSYGYSNGRITSVTMNGTTILGNVQYEPFGPLASWTWGSGASMTRSYDLDGRPGAIDSAGNRLYSYDDAARITAITDTLNSAQSWSYGYDLRDRLTAASRTGLSQTFTYDHNGNRLTQGGTTSTAYTNETTSNRLTSTTGALARTYSYDAAGNTTGYGNLSFSWGDAGRMASATASGTTTSYLYNGLGERVGKSSPGATRIYLHDEAGHLLGTYDGAGALIEEYLWLDDTPVALLRPAGAGTTVYYLHTDHLATPIRLTRASDNLVVWRWDADPFGSLAPAEDPDGDTLPLVFNLRFPGQYYDSETGLHYNYFRDYDPAIGRYVESDPIGLDGGINTYGYVSQNPLAAADPLGLTEWTVVDVVQAGLVGGIGGQYAIYTLRSACDSTGRRYTVTVHAAGASAGLGLKCKACWTSPAEVSLDGMFEDHSPQPNPSAFNGPYLSTAVGGQLLGFGGEYGDTVLGRATSLRSFSPALGAGTIGAEIVGTIGSARVVETKTEPCACQ